jgi:uncharacterized protein (DUF488 family)
MAARETLASRRKTAQRLLQADAESNRLVRAERSRRQLGREPEPPPGIPSAVSDPVHASTIVSIGYEGRSAEEVVDALVESGVAVLVDVRLNAISRKAGLSKRALAERCKARGIEYMHEPTLGNPRDNRDGFREGRPENHRAFEQHLVVQGADALVRVGKLLKDRTVGLLCFEADACSCHRSIVAEHLKKDDPAAMVQLA